MRCWHAYKSEVLSLLTEMISREVCCSLGCETFLRELAYYLVYISGLPVRVPRVWILPELTEHFVRHHYLPLLVPKATSLSSLVGLW